MSVSIKVVALSCTLVGICLEITAADPVVIASASTPNHPQQPQVCIDETGAIHLTFATKAEVKYCRSDDGGKTFSAPVNLPPYRVLAVGMRRGPRIATSGTTICVSVIGGEQGMGTTGDLLAFRSEDKGETWQGPIVVNDVPTSAREGLHAMASSPKGQIACVWLDLRNKGTEIMAALSQDGGKTWGANTLVYRSPDGSVCECCNPSVTFGPKETLHVMWRNSLGGARDMYATTSNDGKSFGKAQKLGSGSWPLDRCPMDGGSIAALSTGGVATAWRRDTSVFFVSSQSNKEQMLGPGEQPWVAASGSGPYVAWVTKRGGPLMLQAPKQTRPLQLAASAGDPCIAAESKKDGLVVVAWEDRSTKESKVVCQVVNNLPKSTNK